MRKSDWVRITAVMGALCGGGLANGQCEVGYLRTPGRGHEMGSHCALDGNSAILDSPGDADVAGSATLFEFDGVSWQETFHFEPSDILPAHNGSSSVDIDADRVIYGNAKQNTDTGKAWVFERIGSEWVEFPLVPSDSNPEDAFGSAVAIRGSTAIVGASMDGDDPGKVYVFVREDKGWVEQQVIVGDGTHRFGRLIAMDEGVALIGAGGSAFVFREAAGVWSEEDVFVSGAAEYPTSLDIDGDFAIVGAYNRAYAYRHVDGVWTAGTELTAWKSATRFGQAVTVEGSWVAVSDDWYGAFDPGGMGRESGTVYLFRYNAFQDEWLEIDRIISLRLGDGDHFGHDLCFSDDRLLIGAPFSDVGVARNGAGYVFDLAVTDCPGFGACCLSTGACAELIETDCDTVGGTFLGEETICRESVCSPSCNGDVDGTGEVDFSDLLTVLAAWGPCP